MKRLLLILFFISPFIIFSQSSNIPRYKAMMDSTEFYTFYDIQKEVESYFANRDKGRGSGYKQYKRCEDLMI